MSRHKIKRSENNTEDICEYCGLVSIHINVIDECPQGPANAAALIQPDRPKKGQKPLKAKFKDYFKGNKA